MKCLIILALLLAAAAVDASPTVITYRGGRSGGRGGMTGGHGGHGGPADELNESRWKLRARWVSGRVGDTYSSVASRGAFADRRLLAKPVPRSMQETEDTEVPEWRQPLAGIKKHVKSEMVGTPLPADRFEPRPRVLLAQQPAAAVVARAMQEEEDEREWRQPLAGIKKHVKSEMVGTPLPADRFDPKPTGA